MCDDMRHTIHSMAALSCALNAGPTALDVLVIRMSTSFDLIACALLFVGVCSDVYARMNMILQLCLAASHSAAS